MIKYSNCIPTKSLKPVFYSFHFTFASYFPISSILSFNFYKQISKKNKLLLKQSYLFLTWFYYLSFIEVKNSLSIVTLPSQTTIFTLTKAPMAHKKNSKEQFKFKFFLFKVSFKIKPHSLYYDINSLLFILLYNKINFIFFETNVFFLKNFITLLKSKNSIFFNFFQHIKLLSI